MSTHAMQHVIAASCLAVTVWMFAPAPASGDTRSERRVEDIKYAISDKQKILDQLGAQREKIEPVATQEKTAYEESDKQVAALESELAEARKAAGEANNALQEVTRQLQEQIAGEPGVQQAQQAAEAAREQYNQAREQAMTSIVKMPEYLRIVDDTETRQQKLALMQDAAAVVDPLEIQTLQFEISQLLVKKRQYVDAELDKLPEVVRTRQALEQASQNLAQVRARYNQQIENNPQRRAADKTATEARLQIADLSARLRTARSELARSKARYARAYSVLAALDKKIDFQAKLMEGLQDELRLAVQDNN